MNNPLIIADASAEPIAYTAKIVAAKRAIEQHHPVPLFNDPDAALLAGDEVDNLLTQWQQVAEKKGIELATVIAKRTRYIAVRTRFLDDLLCNALNQRRQQQVVILGAGLDTRAFRLSCLSGTPVYEIDYPEILHYKMKVLQNRISTCIHHLVSGDLAHPESQWVTTLFHAGYQPEIPTVWIIEGVVMYLPAQKVHTLLNKLSQLSCVGSSLGMDGVTVGSVAAGNRARQSNRGRVIRFWQFGHDDPQQLLASYGWSPKVSLPQDIAGGYGRYERSMPIDLEVGQPTQERGVWFVSAQKN
jgi:methyltransferase (TIGR00027 family)